MKTIMLLLLAKKKPSSITLPLLARYHHPLITDYLPRFCSASATQNPVPKSHNFMVDEYLMASFGFSSDKAARISKYLNRLKSPEKPDSVIRFLNHQGFSEAEIQTLVTSYPTLLSSNSDSTLEPNLHALRDMGLSSSALTQIILTSPGALLLGSAVSRIKFWWDFFGGNEVVLVKAFKRNKYLIGHDINKNITPKISLLQSHGFSTNDIKRMVLRIPRFIKNNISVTEKLLERAKGMGFRPESGMFVEGLRAVSNASREAFQKKMEILKTLGWSEEEFLCAFQKDPTIVGFSEDNLRAKMDFLLREAKCGHSYITTHPGLFRISLERRMRPRQHALHLLESKGLFSREKGNGFYGVMSMSDNKFMEKYILPNKNKILGLHEVYLAACSP